MAGLLEDNLLMDAFQISAIMASMAFAFYAIWLNYTIHSNEAELKVTMQHMEIEGHETLEDLHERDVEKLELINLDDEQKLSRN